MGKTASIRTVAWIEAFVMATLVLLTNPAKSRESAATLTSRPPNIVVVLLDDIGFADSSTFGGLANTPLLDQLSAQGLKYINFNTAGICSATRAALLTGRNHHRVGFGGLADDPGPTPSHSTSWNTQTSSVAEVLKEHGYSTAAVGKWHNTPWSDISPVGPFDRWPTHLGFDYFYGFMEPGAQSEWEPSSLYRDTIPVEPSGKWEQGYHLTVDLTSDAIRWIQSHRSLTPEKPYFLYFAPGAVHFPHHVPKQWIEKYRGKFDQGWDRLREEIFTRQKILGVIPPNSKLTPRPKEIPAWDSLQPNQKALFAHQMEVYAAFIEHTDHELTRLINAIQAPPSRPEDTLILFIVGDNGGSPGYIPDSRSISEQLRHSNELGGPEQINGIEEGWGWAGSTPFQWYKSIASHFGAVRNPLIVVWPLHVTDTGGIRSQFVHVSDIAATIYDVAEVSPPTVVNGKKQLPLDGVSFAPTFNSSTVPSQHHIQYFEIFGNRAIYDDGWVAAARHTSTAHTSLREDFSKDQWELYHVAEDFSEAIDLAKTYPHRLEALKALFNIEARDNGVYPLGEGQSYADPFTNGTFAYSSGFPRIIGLAAPTFQRSHRIAADLVIPANGAEGIIASYGNRWSGFVLYVKDGHIIFESHTYQGRQRTIRSETSIPAGRIRVDFAFNPNGKSREDEVVTGIGRLYVNHKLVGESPIEIDYVSAFWGTFSVGRVFGSPVSSAYESPFTFTGELERLTVDLHDSAAIAGK